ncbi:MAG: heavy-metal-associated domain-containing protein [Armatimonadota bacterium]|nr:heavy-metal-associated domain-containing protein [Armatimonadota bacterium]MDR7460663.1 heavy-metal-associated domain-containing protein [Armatimonadota bacterium]MDR7479248.1 heavy-metal-associated domain-containing protein [Armatimonadota bacterium]MDR7487840.1 heavy-metal-associated domain-containing protein [Armatimonadota bacterium]MDR7490118.1 heavy-metal-associated domain-containing protein [Armatimonadota bacterium]
MKRTFKIPRIHCEGCVATVTATLQRLPGVTRVEGRAESREVDVVFDPAQVSEERLREALAIVGYPPAAAL